jgi:hypothetical protein
MAKVCQRKSRIKAKLSPNGEDLVRCETVSAAEEENYKELFPLEKVCEDYIKLRMGHVFGTYEFVELFLG